MTGLSEVSVTPRLDTAVNEVSSQSLEVIHRDYTVPNICNHETGAMMTQDFTVPNRRLSRSGLNECWEKPQKCMCMSNVLDFFPSLRGPPEV